MVRPEVLEDVSWLFESFSDWELSLLGSLLSVTEDGLFVFPSLPEGVDFPHPKRAKQRENAKIIETIFFIFLSPFH